MATLKEHQAAMVDLLASGSGIPASASRLAHALHDVLTTLANWRVEPVMSLDEVLAANIKHYGGATTPGLTDKAFTEREKALKTDSPAKWPTPAEQRVKELENTIRQLKANNRALRQEVSALQNTLEFAEQVTTEKQFMAEQAGCRKEDTQVCDHNYDFYPDGITCLKCGVERA